MSDTERSPSDASAASSAESTPADAPSAEPPSAEPPSAEPPSAEAPTAEPPSPDAPSAEPPSGEPPSPDAPSAEPPSADAPSAEPPTAEPPSPDAPSAEPPSGDAPSPEPPSSEPPSPEAPNAAPAPGSPAPAQGGGSAALRLAIVVGVPVAALLFLFLRPRHVDLIVDNGHAHPVRVAVGPVTTEVPARAVTKLEEVPAGAQELVWHVLDGQSEEETTRVELAGEAFGARPTYVWPPGGPQRGYWVVTRAYGDATAEELPAPSPFALPEGIDVARLPAELEPTLDEPLPDKIRVEEGQTGTLRRALWTEDALDRLHPLTLLLDNRTTDPLRVEVDGEEVGVSAPQRVLALEVPHGEVSLRAVPLGDGEAAGETHEVTGELTSRPYAGRSAWVWVVGGEPTFTVVASSYGEVDAEAVPEPTPFEAPGRLFEVPPDLLPVVDAFPRQVPLPEGEAGAVHRALFTPRGLDAYRAGRPHGTEVQPATPFSLDELRRRLEQQQEEGRQ